MKQGELSPYKYCFMLIIMMLMFSFLVERALSRTMYAHDQKFESLEYKELDSTKN